MTVPKHLKAINPDHVDWRAKDRAYWQSVLTPEQFRICRQAGTEMPYSGEFCSHHEPGRYACVCCGRLLFESKQKFESGTGWPSFTEPIDPEAIKDIEDYSHGMSRVEVRCNRCDAHLGHVFDDGRGPGAKRYCINSVCLYHLE